MKRASALDSLLRGQHAADGPERVPADFATALSSGRLEAATACFTRDACLVTPDATAVHGRAAIRLLLAQMIDRKTRIEILFSTELRAAETMLSRQRWAIQASGSCHHQDLDATLVLRRLEDGWKLAIVTPWS